MGEKEQWCLFAAGDQEAADTLRILKCTHKITSVIKLLQFCYWSLQVLVGSLVTTQGSYDEEKYRMCINEPRENAETPADADIGSQWDVIVHWHWAKTQQIKSWRLPSDTIIIRKLPRK